MPVSESVYLDLYLSNNLWADAELIFGELGTTSGTLFSSDLEASETDLDPRSGTKSVWYRWTPPTVGAYYFQADSEIDTALDIVRVSTSASTGTLVAVSSNTNHINQNPRAALLVESLEELRIRVSSDDEGAFILSWGPTTLPLNYLSDKALPITATGTGTTYDAPTTDNIPRAWYKYTNRRSNPVELTITPVADHPDQNTFGVVTPVEMQVPNATGIPGDIFVDDFSGPDTEVWEPPPGREGWTQTGLDGFYIWGGGGGPVGYWDVYDVLDATNLLAGLSVNSGLWKNRFTFPPTATVAVDGSVQFNGHSTLKITGLGPTDSFAVGVVQNDGNALTSGELATLPSLTGGAAYRLRMWVQSSSSAIMDSLQASFVVRGTDGWPVEGTYGFIVLGAAVIQVEDGWGLIEIAAIVPTTGQKPDVSLNILTDSSTTSADYVRIGEVILDKVAIPAGVVQDSPILQPELRPSRPIVQDLGLHHKVRAKVWDSFIGDSGIALRVQDEDNFLLVDGLGITSVVDGRLGESLILWVTPIDSTAGYVWLETEDNGKQITVSANGVVVGSLETDLYAGATLAGLSGRNARLAWYDDYEAIPYVADFSQEAVLSVAISSSALFSIADGAGDGSMGSFSWGMDVANIDPSPGCDIEGWWDCDFTYRKKIEITGPDHGLEILHPVTITLLKTDSLSQGKIRTDYTDIQIVRHLDDGFDVVECVITPTTDAIAITFPVLDPISEGVVDDSYYVYYGNPEPWYVAPTFSYAPAEWPSTISLVTGTTYTLPGEDWTFSSQRAVSTTKHAKLTSNFYGSQLQIRADRSVDAGMIEVSIDDELPVLVDLFSRTPELNVSVYEQDELSDMPHTLRVMVSGQTNPSSVGETVRITGINLKKTPPVDLALEEVIPLRWTSGVGGQR